MHFCTYLLSQSSKILSNFSKLSAILKHGEKNFVVVTSIVHLSYNRSWARTNQNSRITWVICHCSITIRLSWTVVGLSWTVEVFLDKLNTTSRIMKVDQLGLRVVKINTCLAQPTSKQRLSQMHFSIQMSSRYSALVLAFRV